MALSDELRRSGIKAMETLADYCDRPAVDQDRLRRIVTGESDRVHAFEMGMDYRRNGASELNCHFSIFTTEEGVEAWERGANQGKGGQ